MEEIEEEASLKVILGESEEESSVFSKEPKEECVIILFQPIDTTPRIEVFDGIGDTLVRNRYTAYSTC